LSTNSQGTVKLSKPVEELTSMITVHQQTSTEVNLHDQSALANQYRNKI